MQVTQIIFSYPRETKYLRGIPELIELFEREGGDIEDYEHVAASVAQGDRILHEGFLWTVVEIQGFTPIGGHDHEFRTAIATLDGSIPKRDGWDGHPPFLYVCMSNGKCLTWGIAEKPQYLPSTGDTPNEFPEHEVSERWTFEAISSSPAGFDQVLVCECVAMEVRDAIAA